MASGRELCYLLLTGILMCYLMAIPILAKPNMFTCSVLRVGLGFALCLCYSSILTKTNRISRIFNRGSKAGIKRPSYTSPKSQIVICCGNVSLSFSLSAFFIKGREALSRKSSRKKKERERESESLCVLETKEKINQSERGPFLSIGLDQADKGYVLKG